MTQPVLNSALRIGIPAIDDDHQRLIALLDALLSNTEAHLHSHVFSGYLTELGRQIAIHFTNEEKFLVKSGMPADEITRHIEVHGEILEQYTQLNLDLMAGKVTDTLSVLVLIKDWIIAHVIAHDLKIRDHLAVKAPGDKASSKPLAEELPEPRPRARSRQLRNRR